MSYPITAKYLIETSYDLQQAAEIMAGEQSCGTFLRTPGETDALREKHGAQVDLIEPIEEVSDEALPGARIMPGRPIKRAFVTLSWPFTNIGFNLPNLVSTIAGNLFELAPFSGLKLLDFDLPEDFNQKYTGPKFGIEGTRRWINVWDRPIIGTIIKPSVGLSPQQTATQSKQLIEAGLDFIKDDELQGDAPHCPFDARVREVMQVIDMFAQKTGKNVMYAFNLSGDLDDMMSRHDFLVKMGATCLMVNLNSVGISAVHHLARHTQLPIHGHRNGWGMLSRSPVLGIEFPAYQKIWRVAGVDHMHTNGIRNKFCESDASVISSIKSCLNPFIGLKSPLPVLSSGQWAGQTVDTYQAVESTDLMYLCGGGIVSHPSGMQAGVKSVIQAWEAAMQNQSLEAYAEHNRELKEALDFFGPKLK
ncbi:MAG: ribulose-bisphosphate carboxylase large subunit family protein [Saprospiraceae bacterium]|nr:ribulose-bisphosphate carboxylase large subunit family protein [Saprospiraceae bacterium]